MSAPRAELSEILPHLELDRALLPGWFARVRAFLAYEDAMEWLMSPETA